MRRFTMVLGMLVFLAGAGAGIPGEKKPNQGTLTVNGRTHKLASALAYAQKFRNRTEVVVLLSEKPLDTAKLKRSFEKHGDDGDWFPVEAHVKLTFDDGGVLQQLTISAGGANIIRSGDPNVKATAVFKDASAQGAAGMKEPDTFRDQPLHFEATFDVALLALPRSIPSVKTPPNPAPLPSALPQKVKAKTNTIPADPTRPPLTVEKELRFEGDLSTDDPKVLGKPAKVHQVRMSPGKTYLIDMESTDFDPLLRILDARGKQVASDDDGGEGLNARIRFTPRTEGTYQIVATRFGSDEGSYLVKVGVLGEDPAKPARAPLVVEKDLRFEGDLCADDPNVLGKPARVHQVKMSPGKTYVIDLESTDFDPYLRVLDASGRQVASDDDGGEGLNARIRLTPRTAGVYQIVATRFGSRQGSYLLKVRVLRADDE
jgi:hypothetical protein